jgi:hypothetical protein
MGRWRGAARVAAVTAVAAMVASACSNAPAVGDGDIGLDWAVLPEPVVATPPSDVCTGGVATYADWSLPGFGLPPNDCGTEHQSETFHVGTLTADETVGAPQVGDELFGEAYTECVKQADAFLGGDHRMARVFLTPIPPSERQWAGGARWFRCELIEIGSTSGSIVKRTASMRDGLRGAKPLALTCANEKLSADKKFVQEVTFVSCATAHDSEMTGIHTEPAGPYPGLEKLNPKVNAACFGVGAKYLGMSRSALDSVGGISWFAWPGGEDAWSVGDRSSRCFMGEHPARKLKGSIKNRRPGNFPH